MRPASQPHSNQLTRQSDEGELTGIVAYVERELPVDPATVVDAPRAELPEVDEVTDESPPPIFPEQVRRADAAKGAGIASQSPAPATRVLWDEPAPPRKRALPKKAIAAAVFGVALLVLPILLRHPAQTADDDSPTLSEDLIVSERDLKNRVEVTADNFRGRKSDDDSNPPSGGEAPALNSDESTSTLAERRKQRAQDPEDLVGMRGRSSGVHAGGSTASEPTAGYQRPYIYFEGNAAASSVRAGEPGTIAPAGTVVSAVLTSPVDLRSGTTTIVARSESDGPIPKSSRFVGSASSDGEGRLTLRFDRLLLPDGREAKVQGEAQDPSGAFGIEGTVTTEGGTNDSATVARDLARDTASDVAAETVSSLTGGLGGRLLQRAIGRASSQRSQPTLATRRVSLPAGARFQIFLHQAVAVRG